VGDEIEAPYRINEDGWNSGIPDYREERRPGIGHHLGHTASLGLLAKALAERDVSVITSAALRAIEREEVVILYLLSGRERREPFDAVVLATLPDSNAELAAQLEAGGIAAAAIGDCVALRKATMALYEARRLALQL
jgi:hypothetical protein